MANRIVREYPRTCQFCGDTFVSRSPVAKWHSNVCRQKMYRWRKRVVLLHDQICKQLGEMGSYIRFPDSRAYAVGLMKDVKVKVDEIWRENGVQKVFGL